MKEEVLRTVVEQFIPFQKFLGMKLTVLKKGFVRMEIPFREELIGDPMRPALHGGVISTLADSAGGAALWSTMEDERGRISTIDLRIDYLRPGRSDTIVAEASVVRVGNRVGVVDVRVFNAATPDVAVATGKAVYSVRTRSPS
jgi:uncharacterized protein (TIGR00369 family)